MPQFKTKEDLDRAVIEISQRDLNRISQILGRNILSLDGLIAQIGMLTTVSVAGVEVTLEPGLLSRLKARAWKEDFPEYVKRTVVEALHQHVGW